MAHRNVCITSKVRFDGDRAGALVGFCALGRKYTVCPMRRKSLILHNMAFDLGSGGVERVTKRLLASEGCDQTQRGIGTIKVVGAGGGLTGDGPAPIVGQPWALVGSRS
jgi:hypothetical protein